MGLSLATNLLMLSCVYASCQRQIVREVQAERVARQKESRRERERNIWTNREADVRSKR